MGLVQSPTIDILPMNLPPAKPPTHNLQPIQPQQPQNYEQYCEKVTCYKCRLCGYLVLSQSSLRHHILDDSSAKLVHVIELPPRLQVPPHPVHPSNQPISMSGPPHREKAATMPSSEYPMFFT